MTKKMKALLCLCPDEVMKQLNLCSVRLNQALSVAVEVVVTAVVPLLEGEAMKPQLSISLGKQTLVVHYKAVIVIVVPRPLQGEAMTLHLSLCYANVK